MILLYLLSGEDEHISDPQQHDAQHLAHDARGAAAQPHQLDARGRRHAQGTFQRSIVGFFNPDAKLRSSMRLPSVTVRMCLLSKRPNQLI